MAQAFEKDQIFSWHAAAGSEAGQAKVVDVRTDRQEGLAPESEDYAALWLEATGISGSRAGQRFTLLLGTDGKRYLDGQEVQVDPAPGQRVAKS